MLKVWGRASSSNVQCVMWCIAELGLDVQRTDAGLMYGVNKSAEYLEMNPNGTIPTVIDSDGPPLWESGAILRYLANKYASDPFWPSDLLQRTNIDRWAEWSKVSVQMSFNSSIFWPVIRTPPGERDANQIKTAIDNIEAKLKIADQKLADHEFLTGPDFTLADIQFGHILFRYYEIDIKRATLDNVQRYYTMLTGRAHYRSHVMISFDELRPT